MNSTLKLFENAIVSFLDELIDQFPTETNLIFARIFLKDQIPIKTTMTNFIIKLEQNNGLLKTMIQNKNDKFFLENNVFCIGDSGQYQIGNNTVNHFRGIWQSNLDRDDRNTIWKWFESFVLLAEKYKKEKQSAFGPRPPCGPNSKLALKEKCSNKQNELYERIKIKKKHK